MLLTLNILCLLVTLQMTSTEVVKTLVIMLGSLSGTHTITIDHRGRGERKPPFPPNRMNISAQKIVGLLFFENTRKKSRHEASPL